MVKLLFVAPSIFAIVATFKALMKIIILATNASKYIPELVRLARRIQGIVGDNREQNPEFFTTTVEFLGFVQDSSTHTSRSKR
jgi:hypothetical protein